MSTPLEEEKRALLERMRASRKNYRSRFPSETHHDPQHSHASPTASSLHSEHPFPRSHTFRFIRRVIRRMRGKQP
jgi:hypothetical protein